MGSEVDTMRGTVWRAALFIISVLLYASNMVIKGLDTSPTTSPWNITGISTRGRGGTTSYISPDRRVFQIWRFIYAMSGLTCFYFISVLIRRHNRQPLFMVIKFVPDSLLYSYIIYHLTAGGPIWMQISKGGEFVSSFFVILGGGVITLLTGLITSSRSIEEHGSQLEREGLKKDLWCMRLIVQNTLALYIGWLSCASIIVLNKVLVFASGVELVRATYICLGILNAAILVWFVLETFAFDKYLRYTFMQYIPFILATVGNYVSRFDTETPYTIYFAVLMILASCLALVKIIVMVVRTIRNPIRYSPNKSTGKFELQAQDSQTYP